MKAIDLGKLVGGRGQASLILNGNVGNIDLTSGTNNVTVRQNCVDKAVLRKPSN